jgi:hypothetical protein
VEGQAPDSQHSLKPTTTADEDMQSASVRPMPPTTTAEDDLRTAGQRSINETWETTQAQIAKAVMFTTCILILAKSLVIPLLASIDVVVPAEWWTVVGLVIGFYFSRSNHQRYRA